MPTLARVTQRPPIASPQARTRFTPAQMQARLIDVVGNANLSRGWIANATDTTTGVTFDANHATVTYDSDITARRSRWGSGYVISFASGSSQYMSMPDSASLSFGNGTVDAPFSLVWFGQVTDTAAGRALLTKSNTGNREWEFRVSTADTLVMVIWDESAGVSPFRASNAAINQGQPVLLGMTYDGTSGATAANGITLYQNGSAITSTATNNASYVAMEDLAALTEMGSMTAHTAIFLDGSAGFWLIAYTALSAGTMASIAALTRKLYRVALP